MKSVVVDMFCGAGGESVGIKAAMPNVVCGFNNRIRVYSVFEKLEAK